MEGSRATETRRIGGREFRVPRTPFRLRKADFEAVPDVSHALGADLERVQTMLELQYPVATAEG